MNSIKIIKNIRKTPAVLSRILNPLENIALKIKDVKILRRACPAVIFANSLILRLKTLEI